MKLHFLPLMSFALLPIALPSSAQDRVVIRGLETKEKDIPIDSIFEPGKLWVQTPDSLMATWKDKGFKWNSESVKDRGIIRRDNGMFEKVKISAFGGACNVEEVAFGLKAGKMADVTIAIWNKGDSENPDITEKGFNAVVEAWTAELNKRIAPSFENRGRDTASAANAERRMWLGKETVAQLEFSGGKERVRDPNSGRERAGKNFQGEFIRLRLLPKPDNTLGLNASTGGAVSVKSADLAKAVVRETSGDVFIPNVPMVDQGDKGYCAVATAARLFNYYGVSADQHEMAQVSGAGPNTGTDPDEMVEAMKKISGKYKTRFLPLLELDYSSRKYEGFMRKYNSAAKKLDKKLLDNKNYIYFVGGLDSDVLREVNGKGPVFDKFMNIVRTNIDKGVPVMWALQLGKYPENGEKARQSGGGHMRLIIGYNTTKNEIIFSDSWGAGHEKKRMAAPDASAATMGLYLLQPSA